MEIQEVSAQTRNMLNPQGLREDFPLLARRIHGRPLVYLDNAATTQKPVSVIDAEADYYRYSNANVHRGIHSLAEEATLAFEATRDKVAEWIGGVRREEVVFTRGTTESLNMVASAWSRFLRAGDKIVLTQMEHHANLVPWMQIAKETGAEIVYLPVMPDGVLDMEVAVEVIDERTKIVAATHMSNVLGTINPVQELARLAHDVGAVMVVDGAQAAPHMAIDVVEIDADFYAFSAHKMMGPTGVGVLYGKRDCLEKMEPLLYGGEMIELVTFERATWAELPHRLEAGTPNIAGVVAFREALDYLGKFGMDVVREHEEKWTTYALGQLRNLDFLTIFGPLESVGRGSVVSFDVDGVHPHDLAQFLDSKGMAVRAGHHCAQPLTRLLGKPATTRASGYIYNTLDDVDELVVSLKEAKSYFG